MSYPAIETLTTLPPAEVNRVRTILGDVLNTELPSDEIDLIDSGMLDSLALVTLILELETNFNITVSYDNLEVDNFRTVDTIAKFIFENM